MRMWLQVPMGRYVGQLFSISTKHFELERQFSVAWMKRCLMEALKVPYYKNVQLFILHPDSTGAALCDEWPKKTIRTSRKPHI